MGDQARIEHEREMAALHAVKAQTAETEADRRAHRRLAGQHEREALRLLRLPRRTDVKYPIIVEG